MSNKAPTLRQFQDRFPTEESCLDHLMRVRYGDRHDCEKCGKSAHFYRVKARRSYACEYCGHQVYPTAGTPFDRTHHHVSRHTMDRLASLFAACIGQRLTYAELIA